MHGGAGGAEAGARGGGAVGARVRLLREETSSEMAEKAAEVRALAGVEVEKMALGICVSFFPAGSIYVCMCSTRTTPYIIREVQYCTTAHASS